MAIAIVTGEWKVKNGNALKDQACSIQGIQWKPLEHVVERHYMSVSPETRSFSVLAYSCDEVLFGWIRIVVIVASFS